MSKPSASATTARSERERKLARLREVARRARWDATEGPDHLQSGRFHPDGNSEMPVPMNGSDAGAIQQDDED
jgi:hypothetical protein